MGNKHSAFEPQKMRITFLFKHREFIEDVSAGATVIINLKTEGKKRGRTLSKGNRLKLSVSLRCQPIHTSSKRALGLVPPHAVKKRQQ